MSGTSEYRISEAAKLLGINKKAVRKRIANGTIESRRVNGKSYVVLPLAVPPSPSLEKSAPDAEPAPDIVDLKQLRNLTSAVERQSEVITELARRVESLQDEVSELRKTVNVAQPSNPGIDLTRQGPSDGELLQPVDLAHQDKTQVSQAEPTSIQLPNEMSRDGVAGTPAEFLPAGGSSDLPSTSKPSEETPDFGAGIAGQKRIDRSTAIPIWRDWHVLLRPLAIAGTLLVLLILVPYIPLDLSTSSIPVVTPAPRVEHVSMRSANQPKLLSHVTGIEHRAALKLRARIAATTGFPTSSTTTIQVTAKAALIRAGAAPPYAAELVYRGWLAHGPSSVTVVLWTDPASPFGQPFASIETVSGPHGVAERVERVIAARRVFSVREYGPEAPSIRNTTDPIAPFLRSRIDVFDGPSLTRYLNELVSRSPSSVRATRHGTLNGVPVVSMRAQLLGDFPHHITAYFDAQTYILQGIDLGPSSQFRLVRVKRLPISVVQRYIGSLRFSTPSKVNLLHTLVGKRR
ncbi:MAG TPA: helix-turn-helix domain-containing protein [Chloroflexota bacterium]